MKSSANESWHSPGSNAPSYITPQATPAELWWLEGPKKDRGKTKERSQNIQLTATKWLKSTSKASLQSLLSRSSR
jgi:hypothetical protein